MYTIGFVTWEYKNNKVGMFIVKLKKNLNNWVDK